MIVKYINNNDIINEYRKSGFIGVSKMLDISIFKLKSIIHENNIVLPNKDRRVDIDNFNNINKKEVAYFLGFFWSDGYISKDEITITIKKDDGDVILNILNLFGKWRSNDRIKRLNGKEFKQKCIRVNDRKIKEFLVDNDFLSKSLSTPTKILSKIPDDIKSYFFRGLIDGDGCFCSKNRSYFSITGNIYQDWLEIEELFKFLDINYSLTRKERSTGNSSYLIISSRSDIIKLGKYIYSDKYDDIGLSRKYRVYKEIESKKNIVNIKKEYNRYIKL